MKVLYLLLLLTTSALFAEQADPFGPFGPEPIHGQPGDEQEIGRLPKHIAGTPGKIVLVADYAAARSHEPIPVYLINRTNTTVTLRAQDFDVYLKLETKALGGLWHRAQSHRYSWCGNSYDFEPSISPGHFLKIDGYQPAAGKRAPVRYKLYGQDPSLPASNEGMALVNEDDVTDASSDTMAVRTGTFKFVSEVALGDVSFRSRLDFPYLQSLAMTALGSGRFKDADALNVIEQVSIQFPAQREEAERLKGRLKQRAEFKTASFELVAQAAMGKISGETKPNDAGFLQYLAVEALSSGRFDTAKAMAILEKITANFPDYLELQHAKDRLSKLWIEEREASTAKWRASHSYGEDSKAIPETKP